MSSVGGLFMFLMVVLFIWGIGAAIASIWCKTWLARIFGGLLIGVGLVAVLVGIVFAGCLLQNGGRLY